VLVAGRPLSARGLFARGRRHDARGARRVALPLGSLERSAPLGRSARLARDWPAARSHVAAFAHRGWLRFRHRPIEPRGSVEQGPEQLAGGQGRRRSIGTAGRRAPNHLAGAGLLRCGDALAGQIGALTQPTRGVLLGLRHGTQHPQENPGRLRSIRRVGLEALPQNRGELALPFELLPEDGGDTLFGEGAGLVDVPTEERAPLCHLEEHTGQREEIALRREPLTACLLGREVARCPIEPAGFSFGLGLHVAGVRARGDPEVEEPRVPRALDHHVARRDVAMDQTELLLGVGQRIGDLHAHVRRLGVAQRPVGEHVRQGRALDVLHRQEIDAPFDAELVHRHDVRVREGHQGLGLVHEHRDEARILREVREDLLDHQPLLEAPEPAEARQVDAGHPSPRDLLVEKVLAEGDGSKVAVLSVVDHVVRSGQDDSECSGSSPRTSQATAGVPARFSG
jgi:hypothetical protein